MENWKNTYDVLGQTTTMNKKKKSNSFATLLLSALILAYSTIIQFSIPSIVLCFGDDGHIAFEQTGNNFQCDKIGDDGSQPTHKQNNLSHQEDDCQDIPLLNVLSALYLEKDGKTKIFKRALVSVKINKINTHLVAQINTNKEATIIHSSMKSLQATILLI